MAGVLSPYDKSLESIIFEFFRNGKTVNQIAKECTELAKSYPDHKKRIEKVNNWHKKYKKLIMLDISKNVTNNIEKSIDEENNDKPAYSFQTPSTTQIQADESNSHTFSLTAPQIWNEQLKSNSLAKAEHKTWVQNNVIPIEKEFYLYYFEEINKDIKNRIKNSKIDGDCKSLISLAIRLGSELKKNPSAPSYMQESIAYLNMLKAEEGAIAAGFIQKKAKVLAINEPQNLEEEIEEIRTVLGYEK